MRSVFRQYWLSTSSSLMKSRKARVFSVRGCVMRSLGFPIVPVVLGSIAETNLSQTVAIGTVLDRFIYMALVSVLPDA